MAGGVGEGAYQRRRHGDHGALVLGEPDLDLGRSDGRLGRRETGEGPPAWRDADARLGRSKRQSDGASQSGSQSSRHAYDATGFSKGEDSAASASPRSFVILQRCCRQSEEAEGASAWHPIHAWQLKYGAWHPSHAWQSEAEAEDAEWHPFHARRLWHQSEAEEHQSEAEDARRLWHQ